METSHRAGKLENLSGAPRNTSRKKNLRVVNTLDRIYPFTTSPEHLAAWTLAKAHHVAVVVGAGRRNP
jgi:hypothetical protein